MHDKGDLPISLTHRCAPPASVEPDPRKVAVQIPLPFWLVLFTLVPLLFGPVSAEAVSSPSAWPVQAAGAASNASDEGMPGTGGPSRDGPGDPVLGPLPLRPAATPFATTPSRPEHLAHAGAASPPPRPASKLDLSQYRGSVVLLHFWASWCPACVEEWTSLLAFYDSNYQRLASEGGGLAFIVISNDLRARDLTGFMSNHRFPFPVYFDPYGDWNARLGVFGLPVTLVINRKGEEIDRWYGAQDWQSDELYRKLEAYIASDARGLSLGRIAEVER